MQVWLMSGAGNDFAVIDARGQKDSLPQLARQLCAITKADGFMALDQAENADFRLHFYNSDGSRAAMCGNGARCICRFAYEKGISREKTVFLTDAGPVSGWRLSESRYQIRLPDPVVGPEIITVGVPHRVIPLPELTFESRELLYPQARAQREKWDANVDFYRILGPNRLRVLTYERGVEDFTQACGTGCGAVAVALGHSLTAQNMGGTLQIDRKPQGLYLTGPTRILSILDMEPLSCTGNM